MRLSCYVQPFAAFELILGRSLRTRKLASSVPSLGSPLSTASQARPCYSTDRSWLDKLSCHFELTWLEQQFFSIASLLVNMNTVLLYSWYPSTAGLLDRGRNVDVTFFLDPRWHVRSIRPAARLARHNSLSIQSCHLPIDLSDIRRAVVGTNCCAVRERGCESIF